MKKNILLVEDNPSVGKLLRTALDKNGYNTFLCISGEDALQQLDASPTDAIILDIILPDIDGLDVLKKIRSHPIHKLIPVIMLTHKDSEDSYLPYFPLIYD